MSLAVDTAGPCIKLGCCYPKPPAEENGDAYAIGIKDVKVFTYIN